MQPITRSSSFWKALFLSIFLLCFATYLWMFLPRQIAGQKHAKERKGMTFIITRGCQGVTARERRSGTIQAVNRAHKILYVQNVHPQTNPFRTEYLDMVLPVVSGSVLNDANGMSISFEQLQEGDGLDIESDCSFIADLFKMDAEGTYTSQPLMQRLVFQAVEVTRQ